MTFQPTYVYAISEVAHGCALLPVAVFSWPNVIKKYIRDTYTFNGELHLPPTDQLNVYRAKLNPKAPNYTVWERINVQEFMNG